jgi:hypothetical protein
MLLFDAVLVVTDVVWIDTGVEVLLGVESAVVEDWGDTVGLTACLFFLDLFLGCVLGSLGIVGAGDVVWRKGKGFWNCMRALLSCCVSSLSAVKSGQVRNAFAIRASRTVSVSANTVLYISCMHL